MNLEQILSTVWRRKRLFLATLAIGLAAVVAITYSLPKTYKATATMFVGVNEEANEALAFDTALGEQLVRTYTALAANPNIGDRVAEELPLDLTGSELLGRMSFAPVERTQLLEISAEAETPEEAQTIANTYADVFKERVDEQVASGGAQAEVAVSEPASKPLDPSKPNPPLYIGLGAVLSAFLALGVVLLRDRIEDPLLTGEDDTEVFGTPVLARIPAVNRRLLEQDPRFADAFALLKANLDFATEARSQVVLVTSPSPGQGKTTIAALLASVSARHGERVVLIEADLRRPQLRGTSAVRGIEESSIGLSNYLAGTADARSANLIVTGPSDSGVRVIWSGPLPPNPSSLLQSPRLDGLIGGLRGDFDRIVIDAPPISVGADVSLLVPRSDAVLYVIDPKTTRRTVANAGVNQLSTANARGVGIVLNRVARSRDGSNYYAPGAGEPSGNGPFAQAESGRRAGV